MHVDTSRRSRSSACSAACPSAATDNASRCPRAAGACSPTWRCIPAASTGGWRPACCGPTSRIAAPPATCARRCGGCSRSAAPGGRRSSHGWAWATTSRWTWPTWRRGRPACWRSAPAPGDLGVDPGPIAELELLPGWYDDWVLAVRERLQLRLLHALEALSRLLRRAGRPAAAVEAMHVAVLAEPLRESGQRALIEAHQAAGDWIAARRQYDAFRSILRREIGVEPSAELTAVARATGPAPGPA